MKYTTNDWNVGFTAAVKITNTGTTTTKGWSLKITFPAGQQLQQGWSATWSQTGAVLTGAGLSWNADLAPGASTEVGFNGSHTGTNTRPTSITLNGAACTVS